MADHFANFAVSQVAAPALTTTATSLTLSTGSGAKFPTSAPFMLLLGDPTTTYELVQCTAIAGDVLTISRHQEGTSASAWGVGASVAQVVTAGNLSNLWSAINRKWVFNALDYGAVGDGVTDDTVAIQATLDAAAAVKGEAVLGAATYATSAALVFNADEMTVSGSGWGTIIKPLSGTTHDVFSTPIPALSTTSGYVRQRVLLRNLKIDQSRQTANVAGQGNAIHFYGARYCEIERIWVYAGKNWAVCLDASGPNSGYNNKIFDCRVDGGTSASGFYLQAEATELKGNHILGIGATMPATQPAFGTQTSTCYNIWCSSGYQDIGGNMLGESGSYTTEVIRLDSSGPSRIYGNRIDTCRFQAIISRGGNNSIVGNQIGSTSQAGAVASIELWSSNNSVVGNIFDVPNPPGPNTYHIREDRACTGNIIADNQFLFTPTLGMLQLNSGDTGTVASHNSGYNPVGYLAAQPAVPASTSAYINRFGVDCTVYVSGGTVTAITVNSHATGLTSGAFRIPAGQSIAITYSAAPTWTWYGD